MKIAYHSFAYGGRSWLPSYDIHETLRRVGALGFDGIELGAVRPHAWPGDLRDGALSAVKRTLRETELEVAAVNATVINHNLLSPLADERADALAYCRDCLKLATDLGAPYLTVVPGWRVYGTTMERAEYWLHQALAILIREAERRGVVMLLEAVNSRRTNFLTTTGKVLAVVNTVGSPYLQPMIDLYHAALEGEDILASLRLVGRDLRYIHFVDAARGSGERKAPGTGDSPLREALTILDEIGYGGYLTVEIWGSDPDDLGRESMAFFRRR